MSDIRVQKVTCRIQQTTVLNQLLCYGLMAVAFSGPVAYAQGIGPVLPDLDSDGVPDVVDIDQDNDGIVNVLEGVGRLTDLSESPAQHFVVKPMDAALRDSSFIYDLVSTENGRLATLVGKVLSSDTEVEWSMHDALPKLRNLASGTTVVQWTIAGEDSVGNIDLSISDLDGERSETLAVSATSIVGYSLSLNSNIVVRRSNGQLIFTGTGAGGDSIDDLITLHFRDFAAMVIAYSNGLSNADDSQLSEVLSGEAAIAGYRHSLENNTSTYFTSVTKHRDSDADGVADHRDLDSDNDGLGDVNESGGVDADHDNMSDGAVDDQGLPVSANPGLTAEVLSAVYHADNLVFGDDADGDGLLSSIDGMPEEFGGARSGIDSDNDGLDDLDEIRIYHTSPDQFDSDSDGLGDEAEVSLYNTSPLQSDSDRDGLSDGEEVNQHGTIPTSADSDADGIVDSEEIRNGTDPLVSDRVVVVLPDPVVSELVTSDPTTSGPEEVLIESESEVEAVNQEVSVVLDDPITEPDALVSDDTTQAYVSSLRTGLGGIAGCSVIINSGSPAPLLPIMLLLAFAGLARSRRSGSRRSGGRRLGRHGLGKSGPAKTGYRNSHA